MPYRQVRCSEATFSILGDKDERLLEQHSCFFIGDCIAQHVIEQRNQHDVKRSVRIVTYAACIGGPPVGTWFSTRNRLITIQNRFKATMVRLAIDQTVFTPTIVAAFLGTMSILEGRSLEQIKEKFATVYSGTFYCLLCLYSYLTSERATGLLSLMLIDSALCESVWVPVCSLFSSSAAQ